MEDPYFGAMSWGGFTAKDEFLGRVSDDWVSAAEVLDIARRMGVDGVENRREFAIGLIARLLVEGLIEAGAIGEKGFERWDLSPGSVIELIITEWVALSDSIVMPGMVAWFSGTVEGYAEGEEVLARLQEKRHRVRPLRDEGTTS